MSSYVELVNGSGCENILASQISLILFFVFNFVCFFTQIRSRRQLTNPVPLQVCGSNCKTYQNDCWLGHDNCISGSNHSMMMHAPCPRIIAVSHVPHVTRVTSYEVLTLELKTHVSITTTLSILSLGKSHSRYVPTPYPVVIPDLPQPIFTVEPSDSEVEEGHHLILECHALSFPIANYLWYKVNEQDREFDSYLGL